MGKELGFLAVLVLMLRLFSWRMLILAEAALRRLPQETVGLG